MSHTPGPWYRVKDKRGKWYTRDIGAPSYELVARSHGPTLQQQEANARLIASAPDLLTALKMLLDAQSSTERQHNRAVAYSREAIDKAT